MIYWNEDYEMNTVFTNNLESQTYAVTGTEVRFPLVIEIAYLHTARISP